MSRRRISPLRPSAGVGPSAPVHSGPPRPWAGRPVPACLRKPPFTSAVYRADRPATARQVTEPTAPATASRITEPPARAACPSRLPGPSRPPGRSPATAQPSRLPLPPAPPAPAQPPNRDQPRKRDCREAPPGWSGSGRERAGSPSRHRELLRRQDIVRLRDPGRVVREYDRSVVVEVWVGRRHRKLLGGEDVVRGLVR